MQHQDFSKFKNVPIDDETTVISREIIQFEKYSALFEIWKWTGMVAQSIIFTDNEADQLSDDEIKQLIRNKNLVDQETELRINRSIKGYTFVNFIDKMIADEYN